MEGGENAFPSLLKAALKVGWMVENARPNEYWVLPPKDDPRRGWGAVWSPRVYNGVTYMVGHYFKEEVLKDVSNRLR
jgi:hypothetical protein